MEKHSDESAALLGQAINELLLDGLCIRSEASGVGVYRIRDQPASSLHGKAQCVLDSVEKLQLPPYRHSNQPSHSLIWERD